MNRTVQLLIYVAVAIYCTIALSLPIGDTKSVSLPPAQKATIRLVELSTEESLVEQQEESQIEENGQSRFVSEVLDSLVERFAPLLEHRGAATQRDEQSTSEVFLEADGTEQEKVELIGAYYDIRSVTTAPVINTALLAKQIIYPPIAKRQRREGVVLLRLFISNKGEIENIVIVDDPGYGFGEAAKRAFKNIDIEAATIEGEPVAVTFLFPLRFTLQY